MDPFDDVTPVGQRAEVVTSSSSTRSIRDVRREVRRATQAGADGKLIGRTNRTTLPRVGSRSRSGTARRSRLSFDDLDAMACEIATRAFDDVKTQVRPGDRKHSTTMFAISTDKLLLLRNRPASSAPFADGQRSGVLELAARLAEAARTGAA